MMNENVSNSSEDFHQTHEKSRAARRKPVCIFTEAEKLDFVRLDGAIFLEESFRSFQITSGTKSEEE